MLRSVADIVYPPSDKPIIDGHGHERDIGPAQYLNRLWQFYSESTEHPTASRVSHATLEDFGHRADRLNDLASKGVHDDVTTAEVDLCVIQTYLLAGRS